MRYRSHKAQVICRDLWALHLSLLPGAPPAEPYFYVQTQYGGGATMPPAPNAVRPEAQTAAVDENPRDDADHTETDGNSSKSSSSSSSDDEEDMEMDRLLRENSIGPSSDEEDEDDDSTRPRSEAQSQTRKAKHAYWPYDSPAANIAVLMLACWTLRLPVMYMDFKRYQLVTERRRPLMLQLDSSKAMTFRT